MYLNLITRHKYLIYFSLSYQHLSSIYRCVIDLSRGRLIFGMGSKLYRRKVANSSLEIEKSPIYRIIAINNFTIFYCISMIFVNIIENIIEIL